MTAISELSSCVHAAVSMTSMCSSQETYATDISILTSLRNWVTQRQLSRSMSRMITALKITVTVILFTLRYSTCAVADILPDSTAALQSQIDALLAFKDALADPIALRSWTHREPCSGKWQGITCSSDKRSVVKMYLRGSKFYGPIPTEIKGLNFLESFVLMNTAFAGQIPKAIENLNRIKTLIISKNPLLNGEFPDGIFNLTNIRRLDLSWNNFTGTLPGAPALAMNDILPPVGTKPPFPWPWNDTTNMPKNLINGTDLQALFNWTKLHWLPFPLPSTPGEILNWTWIPFSTPSDLPSPLNFTMLMPGIPPMFNFPTPGSLMNLTWPMPTNSSFPPAFNIPFPWSFLPPLPIGPGSSVPWFLSNSTWPPNLTRPSMLNWTVLLPLLNTSDPSLFNWTWPNINETYPPFLNWTWPLLNSTMPPMFNWIYPTPNGTAAPFFNWTFPPLNTSAPPFFNWTGPGGSAAPPLQNLFNWTLPPLSKSAPPPLFNWTWPPVNLPKPPPFNWNPLNISVPPLPVLNWTWPSPITAPPAAPLFNWTWPKPPTSTSKTPSGTNSTTVAGNYDIPPVFPSMPASTEVARQSSRGRGFGNLPNLKYLDLSHNAFLGAVPQDLEKLTKLDYLNLSTNFLFGETPFELFGSPHISSIDLSNNFLTGTIESAAQFAKSITINISENCLKGVDPSRELAPDQKISVQHNCLNSSATCKCIF